MDNLQFDDILSTLEAVDWFEGYSDAARETAVETIRRAWTDGHGDEADDWTRQVMAYPAALAISIWGDAECIYEPGDYTALLESFKDGCFGLFNPTGYEEEWGSYDERTGCIPIRLSFEENGKRWSCQILQDGDWIDEAALGLVDEALGSHIPPLELYCPQLGWGQDFGLVICTTGARRRALEAGLLPGEEMTEEELEALEALELAPPPEDAAACLAELEAAEWFAGMGEALKQSLCAGVEQAYRDGRHPATGLAGASLSWREDLTADIFRTLLQTLIAHSSSLFGATEATVEEEEGAWKLTLTRDGTEVTETVWFDPESTGEVAQFDDDPFLTVGCLLDDYLERFEPAFRFHHFTDQDFTVHFLPCVTDHPGLPWLPDDVLAPLADFETLLAELTRAEEE